MHILGLWLAALLLSWQAGRATKHMFVDATVAQRIGAGLAALILLAAAVSVGLVLDVGL